MEAQSPSFEPVADLCEGDLDPGLKKTVHYLIARRLDFIVYLDPECGVQWRIVGGDVESASAGAQSILNDVSLVETLSLPLRQTPHLAPVRRLLGEAVARLFGGGEAAHESAESILAGAKAYLQNRMAEMARIWYLSAAGFCALLAMISMAVVWLDRERISFAFSPMVVDVLLGAAFGAIGSFMSLLTRSAEIKVAAGAGRTIHYVESISRITAGLVGALLVALAIKANLLLGAMATAGGLPLLLLVCIVAGASERLVPSLIARVESSALSSPAVGNSNSIARPARTRMLS